MHYIIPTDPAERTPYQSNLARVRDRIVARSDGAYVVDECGAIQPATVSPFVRRAIDHKLPAKVLAR